ATRDARAHTLVWVALPFLSVNLLTRAALLIFEGDSRNFGAMRLFEIFATGTIYDLAALSYLIVPFALLGAVIPNRAWGRKLHGVLVGLLSPVCLAAWLFVGVSELVFWNEFSARFNFIAVDYLIYTREVIGNIYESYPVAKVFLLLGAVAITVFAAIRKPLWRAAVGDAGGWRRRWALALAVLVLPVASFFVVRDGLRERIDSASARELAGNGYYEFMRALRANDLDYRVFYKTVQPKVAEATVRQEFQRADSHALFVADNHPLARRIAAQGTVKPLNVVLVSIESLGADYVESFGGRPGLTPVLDRLGSEGLRFTQLYATGLRTVRGLEALALSVPPTPGHGVLMRKNNKGFATLGGVLKEKGYDPLYIYGGYSYFDNMNDFFSGNGYTVIDRTSIAKEHITHETIWGVADEDLFHQALREIDSRAAKGQRVFAHIMTTSNHRPYTYPNGRIDIDSGTGRSGAVKYTDWAIGNFLNEARTKPWFKETLFVLVADHTSHGRGHTDLPPENYRIPMIIYAPGHVSPGRIDYVASQIDVAPTLLGLLNLSYVSRFFGQDILSEGRLHQRAFMSNYLTVGYMQDGVVIELSPKKRVHAFDAKTGKERQLGDAQLSTLIQEAESYYQVATAVLRGTFAPPALPLDRPS
ncbi:MAG TPA: sulfatase-like hydrolase/transferase, partial [Candidatus Binatia bacterium]